MIYRWLADLTVLAHGAFVAFVVLGGFVVVRWRRLVWLHVPAAIWGVLIEFGGWICPLTPIENTLRQRAGEAGYSGGFVEHYVLHALYPNGLTRGVQWLLGILALAVNTLAYGIVIHRARSS
ncbi:MAG TPA: DUF2784 domain-containing protein [Gemmatimonadaceae bacterium]